MFAVPAERCFSTDALLHRNHRIQRSLASRRRASGVEETEMREKARRKESGDRCLGSAGRGTGEAIRCANRSAPRRGERPRDPAGASRTAGVQGPARAFPPHRSHPSILTAHPGCGWAAGPCVCWSCCSPAPRWGSCTRAPGTRPASGHLWRCGRPCRRPPGQSSQTWPRSPAMHTSLLGSRSEWWGECWEGWRQRDVAGWVVWAAFVCSTAQL